MMFHYFIKPFLFLVALCTFLFIIFIVDTVIITPYNNAIKIEKEAIQGDPESQRVLGYAYDSGVMRSGTLGKFGKDRNKAIYWYEKSANQGNSEACVFLAQLYERDKISNSDTLAVQWYTKAAELGDKAAAEKLSQVYSGLVLGQHPDPKKAEYWRDRAKQTAE